MAQQRLGWDGVPTRIKICGVTRLEDATLAVELGAAALGFNFYRASPRYVAPADARAMIERLPPFVTPVGVFVEEESAEAVIRVAREAGVAALQWHGRLSPALRAALAGFALICAKSAGPDFKPESLNRLDAAAVLLDTYDPNLKGGTGRTYDWSMAREAGKYAKVILAGGLTPENVGDAIRAGRPYGVDVASGVESSPGIKDASKLRDFFTAALEADRALGDGRMKRLKESSHEG